MYTRKRPKKHALEALPKSKGHLPVFRECNLKKSGCKTLHNAQPRLGDHEVVEARWRPTTTQAMLYIEAR